MRFYGKCLTHNPELKIIELRERAKGELAGRFSLKEFHNVVLGTGTVPLEILEQQVNRWIQSKKVPG